MIRLGWGMAISLRTGLRSTSMGSVHPNTSVPLYRITESSIYSKRTSSSTSVAPSQERKNGYYEKASWFISAEWKILTSVLVAVISYHLNARLERLQLKKEMKLSRIQRQIKELYGPLYGNRLVNSTSFKAVMGHHGALKKYLEEARKKKDAEMLWRWRSYVWNVLYPLDKAAVEMICDNAHLIIDGKFPEEFEQLLIHTAKLEFAMERWKSPNGKLESPKDFTDDDFSEDNNASGVRQRSQLLLHVKENYDALRDERHRISLEISSDKRADGVLSFLFTKAMS